MTLSTKYCSDCDSNLSLDCFSFRNKKKGTRQAFCKACMKTRNAKVYINNKKSYFDSSYSIRIRNRKFILEYLQNKSCIDCGISDPILLEFDHIDPSTKDIEVCKMMQLGYSVERIQKEIDKCEIRCANCHRLRTAKQFNWYAYANKCN